jgi:hypothetical protein
MNLTHIVQESELNKHIDIFGFPLLSAKDEFNTMLASPWCSSKLVLSKKQDQIRFLRKHKDKTQVLLDQLALLKDSEATVKNYKPNESSKIADGQIFFLGEHTKALNFIPYFITFCVFLKVWVAPILALLTPLFLAITPYLIMTTIMDMPITWDMYTVLMKQMVFGIQTGEPWRLKHYAQALWTFLSVAQGMISPFITAYHTRNLDAEIVKRGESLLHIHSVVKSVLDTLREMGCPGIDTLVLPDIPYEPHEAVAWMTAEPLGIQFLWKIIGRLTIMFRIAVDEQWSPVNFNSQNKTLELSNFSDLAIKSSKTQVKSSICLHEHSLLTGPNRGGKSSCLRGILQQVILGQVTGFTYEAVGKWCPFQLIFTRLKSRDTAGKESLFEMEVRFASQIIKTLKHTKQNSLVLIDELFHSTNPPDAEISAKLFLEQLWSFRTGKSIISTHIFSLCETEQKAPIQTFCCNAELQSSGKLKYSYEMTEGGICRVSSVREVLSEAGLVRLNEN